MTTGISSSRIATILCAEDEPELRRDLVEELREAGYEVLEASNGEEALMAILTLRPDLVLCDINMPKMTGLEVLERVRAGDQESAETPFIFLTAYGEKSDHIKGRALGADDYLVKPIDYDLLLATVQSRMESFARAKRRVESRAWSLEQQLTDLLSKNEPEAGVLPDSDALRQLLRDENLPDSRLVLAGFDAFHRLRPQFGNRFAQMVLTQYLDVLGDSAGGLPMHLFQLEGDVFALLVEGADAWQRMGSKISALADTAFVISGQRLPITSTLTVAEYHPGNSRSALEMLEDSLLALQFARRNGGRVVVHVDAPARDRLRIIQFVEENFARALNAGELFLAFQPKVALANGRPVGGEALIRWQSPERGLISPALFIPIVERTGFVDLISEWVLDRAAAAIAELAGEHIQTSIAVNASGAELHGRFVDRVDEVLARHAIPPAALEIEITETSVVLDMDFAATITQRLRERGASVVIDDFGTGFSSLSYLRAFPLDGIKIDQSFIRGLTANPIDRQIVESVIGLSRAIGLKTVAEGVETQAEYDLLKHMGCDIAQGFLIAKPLTLPDFKTFLADTSGEQSPLRT
jgi:EAL domain-containing protein (putative c-di-GMP-specific phosphodiesterase class I)/PleD family two-component response regulator